MICCNYLHSILLCFQCLIVGVIFIIHVILYVDIVDLNVDLGFCRKCFKSKCDHKIAFLRTFYDLYNVLSVWMSLPALGIKCELLPHTLLYTRVPVHDFLNKGHLLDLFGCFCLFTPFLLSMVHRTCYIIPL